MPLDRIMVLRQGAIRLSGSIMLRWTRRVLVVLASLDGGRVLENLPCHQRESGTEALMTVITHLWRNGLRQAITLTVLQNLKIDIWLVRIVRVILKR